MTGSIERVSLRDSAAEGASQETIALHLERYRFASRFSQGKTVLDIACGTGYGSNILATDGGAASVIGVDIDSDAITQAGADYTTGNSHFLQSDYRNLKSKLKNTSAPELTGFDMIVSLETIEHLPDPDHFLQTVLQLLSPGGTFVGSVPVTPSMDANPYHLQDFSAASFRGLLQRNGLRILDNLYQVQPYNPLTVKAEMNSGDRKGLRQNLVSYYLSHPNKLASRIYSSLRFGFANHYEVIAAQYNPQTATHRSASQ